MIVHNAARAIISPKTFAFPLKKPPNINHRILPRNLIVCATYFLINHFITSGGENATVSENFYSFLSHDQNHLPAKAAGVGLSHVL